MPFVSRAGQKLDHALSVFAIDVTGLICADLGCSTGGFTDCLLQHGAACVFAVDNGYGVIDWKLRKDSRVVVMERTNAMHVTLPRPVDLVTIDTSWTRQKNVLPHVSSLLKPEAWVITLIKPHYEADPKLLRKGVLPEQELHKVRSSVELDIVRCGFDLLQSCESPIKGAKGNTEILALLKPTRQQARL